MFSGFQPKISAHIGRIERVILRWVALWMSLGRYTVLSDDLGEARGIPTAWCSRHGILLGLTQWMTIETLA